MNWKVVRNMSRSQDSNPSYSGKTPSLCHSPHHRWHLTQTWGFPHVPSSIRMFKKLKTWTTKHIKIVQGNTYLRNDPGRHYVCVGLSKQSGYAKTSFHLNNLSGVMCKCTCYVAEILASCEITNLTPLYILYHVNTWADRRDYDWSFSDCVATTAF